MRNKEHKMTEDLGKLIEERIFPAMIEDYKRFMPPTNKIRVDMFNDFVRGLTYKAGSKYIKITDSVRGGVKMFVVAKDGTKGFKRGDILKPAGYAAPATNFARGNVIDNDMSGVRWTGAL
jgi:hypothetical protein